MASALVLADHVRQFLAQPGRFVALASLDPDGAPRQAFLWYRLDADGAIVVNSADGRRWPANLRRDGRAALAVADAADGYRWVGVDVVVETVVDDQAVAQADIADLARRYHPADPATVAQEVARFRTQHRVSFHLRPVGLHDHLA